MFPITGTSVPVPCSLIHDPCSSHRSVFPLPRTEKSVSARSDFDVIVVGAGPAGGMAARSAAALGLRTLLVEEHPQVGTPAHCSGKLQLHAFREFGLPSHLVTNTLQAGAFYAPSGAVVRVRRAVPDSYVVDRTLFDRWLAEDAAARGAELLVGTRVRAAERVNGTVRVVGERAGKAFAAAAPVIIDAEGARPILPQMLGLPLPKAYVHGLQYQMDRVDLEEEDCPEIYLGADSAPGFFAWMMPIGGRRARVGLCVDPRIAGRAPLYYLERLLAEHPQASRRFRRAVMERKLAGLIPILGPRRPTAADGLLVVGDAAGQVKATSGGGIYFSLIAGRLAAQAAGGYVGGDGMALRRYEREWRRRFGREIKVTVFARVVLNRLTDSDLNRLIAAISADERLRRIIEERGDTAFQSRLLRPLLAHALAPSRLPAMAGTLAKALRYGLVALWDDGAAVAQDSAVRAHAEENVRFEGTDRTVRRAPSRGMGPGLR